MHILFIEDERTTALYFADILRAIFSELPGAFVTIVPGCQDAMRLVKEQYPDVVVADLNLTDCTQEELIAFLKTVNAPAVILTEQDPETIQASVKASYPVVRKQDARKKRGLLAWIILKTFLKSEVSESERFKRRIANERERFDALFKTLASEIPPDEPLRTST